MFQIKLTMIFLAAFFIVYFTVPLAMKLAYHFGAIDQPDPRKVHQKAMPRLGGLSLFVGIMLPTLFVALFVIKAPAYWGIVLGGIIAFLVGLLDDLFSLPPLAKLAGQSLAAIIAIHFGIVVEFMTNPFNGMVWLGYLSYPITFLWMVGIINAVNLIDGLDGLAAGVSGIAALTLGTVAFLQGNPTVFVLSMVILAAVLGFLPYNFYPAKIFMGDGGSNFLGFMLGTLAVLGAAKTTAVISLFVPIVILGIPIFDTFFAIVRRFYNKTNILQPDKNHLHHRLMALGLNHRQSVLTIYAISTLFGLTAIIISIIARPEASILLAILLLFVLWGARKTGICTEKKPEPPEQIAERLKI